MYQVFAAVVINVTTPYEVTLWLPDVELPAANKETPVFGVTVTLPVVVCETIIMVLPFEKATLDVVGIYKFTLDEFV